MSWFASWISGERRPELSEAGLEELERKLLRGVDTVDATLRFGDVCFSVSPNTPYPSLGSGIIASDERIAHLFATLISDQEFPVTTVCQRKFNGLNFEQLLITLGDLEQKLGNQRTALELYSKAHDLAHSEFCGQTLTNLETKEHLSKVLIAKEKRSNGDIKSADEEVNGLSEQLRSMVLNDLTIDELRVLVAHCESIGDFDGALAHLEKANQGNLRDNKELYTEFFTKIAQYEHHFFANGDFDKARQLYSKLDYCLRSPSGFYLINEADLENLFEYFIPHKRYEDFYNLIKSHAKSDTARVIEAGKRLGNMAYEDSSLASDSGEYTSAQKSAQTAIKILLDTLRLSSEEDCENEIPKLFFCLKALGNETKLVEFLRKYSSDVFTPPTPLINDIVSREIIFRTPALREQLYQYFISNPVITYRDAREFAFRVLNDARPGDVNRTLNELKAIFINSAIATTPPPPKAAIKLLGIQLGRTPLTPPEEVALPIEYYNTILDLMESKNLYPAEEDLNGWVKELISLYKNSNQEEKIAELLKRLTDCGINIIERLKASDRVLSQEKIRTWLIPFVDLLRKHRCDELALSLTKKALESYESEIFHLRTMNLPSSTIPREITPTELEQIENGYKLLLRTGFSITEKDSHLNFIAAMYDMRDYYRQQEATPFLTQTADSGRAEKIYHLLKAAYLNSQEVHPPLVNEAKRLYLATFYDFSAEMHASYPGHPLFKNDKSGNSEHDRFNEEYLLSHEWGTSESSDQSRYKAYFREVITDRLKGLTFAKDARLLFPLNGDYHIREVASRI